MKITVISLYYKKELIAYSLCTLDICQFKFHSFSSTGYQGILPRVKVARV